MYYNNVKITVEFDSTKVLPKKEMERAIDLAFLLCFSGKIDRKTIKITENVQKSSENG